MSNKDKKTGDRSITINFNKDSLIKAGITALVIALIAATIVIIAFFVHDYITKNRRDTSNFETFEFGEALDEYGYFDGLVAGDYVDLKDFDGITIPESDYTFSDEEIATEIVLMLEYYGAINKITDRQVEFGDRINLDYDGTIDGVAFEGGSTYGQGFDAVAGDTESMVDGFLVKVIKATPGEKFDIFITFPDDYYEELAGKRATFAVTVNYIIEDAELTDEVVAEYLFDDHGWSTAEEATEGLLELMQDYTIGMYVGNYVWNEIIGNIDLSNLDEKYFNYFRRMYLYQVNMEATAYNYEYERWLLEQYGFESKEAFIEAIQIDVEQELRFRLFIQAGAEQFDIKLTDADFEEKYDMLGAMQPFDVYIEEFGVRYGKAMLLSELVYERIIEGVILG